jgi:hypothetical protein
MRASIRGQASDVEGPKAQVAVAGCRHYRRQPDVPDVVPRRRQEYVVTLERML